MNVPPAEPATLRGVVQTAGALRDRWLWARDGAVELAALMSGSSLGGRLAELRGRSVLLAVADQLPAALALIELDGVARRIVLRPPGVAAEHLPAILAGAEIDAIVADPSEEDPLLRGIGCFVPCHPRVDPVAGSRLAPVETQWVLLTSGTTGPPKLALHTFRTLAAPILGGARRGTGAIWSTFYDIRRYGGLQILLRAMLGGGSLMLSSHDEPVAEFLARAGARGITHISGTPSHLRRVLMSPAARRMAAGYVRLSGEIADQAVLDQLRATYPDADIGHAFASTEAGVGFEVDDGLAGFPASVVEQRRADLEIKIADDSLRIRSDRTALGYLDGSVKPLADPDGFVDTGDIVERRGARFQFIGRRGGIINVGGNKVHPEKVEAVINRHPQVLVSVVKGRKNPISGAVVVADIVPRTTADKPDAAAAETLRREIMTACRSALAPYQVPAVIRFVPALEIGAAGKLLRSNA
jgi:acyl-CoA synthetase (AMP-forming)/AMP-acid ligase II